MLRGKVPSSSEQYRFEIGLKLIYEKKKSQGISPGFYAQFDNALVS